MFVTFETTESKFITIDITKVKSWTDESLVAIACEQLGTDYIDYQDRKKRQKKGVTVTPINWSPLKAAYRQMLTIKRPPRKFAISF